jgi:hypothetical protein
VVEQPANQSVYQVLAGGALLHLEAANESRLPLALQSVVVTVGKSLALAWPYPGDRQVQRRRRISG